MLEPATLSDISQPKIQMAFACDGVSQDMFQRVTFSNVIDDLNAPRFPIQTAQLFIIFGFEANIPQIISRVKVSIEAPGGQKLAEQALQDMAFTTDRYRHRLISGFVGLIWPAEGRYTCKATSGDRVLASFTITLRQIPTPPTIPPTISQPPSGET